MMQEHGDRNDRRRPAVFTVDLEDYRFHVQRDRFGLSATYPREVSRQLHSLVELAEALDISGTFFTCGHLVRDLPSVTWQALAARHEIGCHGYDHKPVNRMTQAEFARDCSDSKIMLEQASGTAVVSYRAPYFSCDGVEDWFGPTLAESGFLYDSSYRLGKMHGGKQGCIALSHAPSVTEVPLFCVGAGSKRLTVIGGTYLRLFPIEVIVHLMRQAEAHGFIPMVYVHPYDIDSRASSPVGRATRSGLADWAADVVRQTGRSSVVGKLARLSEIYAFQPIAANVAA